MKRGVTRGVLWKMQELRYRGYTVALIARTLGVAYCVAYHALNADKIAAARYRHDNKNRIRQPIAAPEPKPIEPDPEKPLLTGMTIRQALGIDLKPR